MPQTVRAESAFTDSRGVRLVYTSWVPERPVAVVQLEHGLGEHIGRYEHVATALAAAGYAVYGDDHRGHGRTGVGQWGPSPSARRRGKPGPGGLRAMVDDVAEFTAVVRQAHPDLPVVLLGHSWGSLLAQLLLNTDRAAAYAGVVLTGTAYRMPGFMNAGDLNRAHANLGDTGFEWLSRDPEVARAFAADPLTFPADVLRIYGVVDGLRLFGRPKPTGHVMPLLIMAGSDDAIGSENGVRKLAREYSRRARYRDVTIVVYPDARHEIFQELNRDEVVTDLLSWLDARFGQRDAPADAWDAPDADDTEVRDAR